METGLAVTDWMTSAVLSGFGADARGAFRDLAGLLGPTAITGSPLAPFVLFLVSVATALLGLVVWLELVMREAAIYVAVAFLPLTLAAMIWDRSALWARRLAELLAAIILSKFTIAVAFAVAASAIRGSRGDAGGLTGVLAGCGVLLVAALTPWALLKLIPFMEAAAGRGLSRGHVSGAANAAPGATTASVATRQLMLKQFGTKGGAARTPSATQPASARRWIVGRGARRTARAAHRHAARGSDATAARAVTTTSRAHDAGREPPSARLPIRPARATGSRGRVTPGPDRLSCVRGCSGSDLRPPPAQRERPADRARALRGSRVRQLSRPSRRALRKSGCQSSSTGSAASQRGRIASARVSRRPG